MKIYNWIMLSYFVALFVVMNWKGNAFLAMSFGPRLAVGLGCFAPLVAWVIIGHVVNSSNASNKS